MPNPLKRKGDAAEREAAMLITQLLNLVPPARRRLGAGRTAAAGGDVGDIDGLPGHVVQVANWGNAAAAAQQKPAEAEQQAQNLGVPHAVTLVRFRGGKWVVVITLAQWIRYLKLIWRF